MQASRVHPEQIHTLPTFRPDIQGLRAVAVIVVILDHLFGWPAGGFIGVDVFFVISGFLITSLMLREHQKTGEISWGDFYRRRVRRILPASTAALVVTTVVAYFVYRTTRFESVLEDGIWSFFFASNWHFAAIGTDYLHASGPVSPLQHFWSLAVEEQFYIVWPILLILVLGVVGRQLSVRGRSVRPLLLGVMGAFAIASFLWAWIDSATDPTVAYFSTFSRGWELAVGAILAAAVPELARIATRIRPVLSYLGVAGILASLFLIDSSSAFPAPWAALPVASAALVIAAGVAGAPEGAWLLTNPVSVYVGKISYSLYLWHFPVIILLAAVMTPDTAPYYLTAVVTMGVLAVLSLLLIEEPVRRSSWLQQPDSQPRTRSSVRSAVGYSALAVAAVAAFVLVIAVWKAPSEQPAAFHSVSAPVSVVDQTQTTQASTGTATTTSAAPVVVPGEPPARSWADQAALSSAIQEALQAEEWPDLTPSLDELSEADAAPAMDNQKGCRNDVAEVAHPQYCSRAGTSGEAATVVVVGDSVAMSWMPAIETALPTAEVMALGFASCPAVPVAVGINTSGCAAAQQAMLDYVTAMHPAVVITSSAQSYLTGLASGATGAAASEEWATATTQFVTSYSAVADSVVIIGNPPAGKDPMECATRLSTPADCETTTNKVWQEKERVEAAAGASFINVHDWFCAADDRCPMMIDGLVLRFDGAHLTEVASRSFGTRLAAELS